VFQSRRRAHISPHNDQCVVGILQNLAWLAVEQWGA
jgi:hypothetical protein